MKPEWIAVGLALVLAAVQLLLAIDNWVHGRARSENNLGRDVAELKRIIEGGQYGKRIGEIRERLSSIDEHLRNTDATVDELKRVLRRSKDER